MNNTKVITANLLIDGQGDAPIDKGAIDLHEGGTAIPYWEEDPYIRTEFDAKLQQEGVGSRMDESFYRRPSGA